MNKKLLIGVGLFIIVIMIGIFFSTNTKLIIEEGFKNLENINSDAPLLADSYKYTGNKYVSSDNSSQIWWHYPIFGVSSFEQITNNLKHRYNPDDGDCSRAEFCGTLYKDKFIKSNVTLPLPPVPMGEGARVGYFRTDENLMPFYNDTTENILY
jgi:hypothetical protein